MFRNIVKAVAGDPNVANSPLSFAWQPGTHTIFFNTRYNLLTGEAGPGDSSNADLWKAEADSGQVLNVMSRNSVGRFFLSPDGKHIALSLPQAVGLVDADGSNFNLSLNFPFVITYADYAYKPSVVWSPDNTFFSVAIPSADPSATDTHVTLYRISVDGNVQTLGILPGNFVFGGQPHLEFSPDGKHAIYGRLAEDNSTSLHLVNTDGSGDVVVDQQAWIRPPDMNWPPDLQVRGLGWSPDSNHYAYSVMPAEGGFLAPVEGPLQSFAPGAPIAALKWKGVTSFVFVGQVNGQWGLYAQAIGNEPRLLASGLNQNAMFDVRP